MNISMRRSSSSLIKNCLPSAPVKALPVNSSVWSTISGNKMELMNYVVPKLKHKELKYHLGTGHFKKHEEGKLENDNSSWVDFSLLGICSLHIYVVKH